MFNRDLNELKSYLKALHKGMVDVFSAMESLNEFNKTMVQQLKDVHFHIIRQQECIQEQLTAIQNNQVMKHDDVTIN